MDDILTIKRQEGWYVVTDCQANKGYLCSNAVFVMEVVDDILYKYQNSLWEKQKGAKCDT